MRRKGFAFLMCLVLAAACILPVAAQAAQQEQQVLQYQELMRNDFTGRVDYYYDTDGRCVREVWTDKDQVAETVEYRYQGSSRFLTEKRVYRKNVLTEYTKYDQNGNPLETRAYSGTGKLETVTRFTNSYDASGRMTSCTQETEEDGVLHYVASGWNYGESEDKTFSFGDIITFGTYEQDGEVSNGAEPIQWMVLESRDDHLLAITVNALDSRLYHDRNVSVTWKNSTIRRWLNGDFLNAAFSPEEQGKILETGTETGCNDRVFLLSLEELNRYLEEQSRRLCQASDYAVGKNAYVNAKTGGSWWLLRTPGQNDSSVMSVNSDGTIDTRGGAVNSSRGGIRPAAWIDISGVKKTVLRFYNTTTYTIYQGVRSISSKERYTYDGMGNLEQYYVEQTKSINRRYDYTNTYYSNQLIYSQCVCTDFDENTEITINHFYNHDHNGRKTRELELYPGGDGYTVYTWEYDARGNLLKYSDQYRTFETNHYGPLKEVIWKS